MRSVLLFDLNNNNSKNRSSNLESSSLKKLVLTVSVGVTVIMLDGRQTKYYPGLQNLVIRQLAFCAFYII